LLTANRAYRVLTLIASRAVVARWNGWALIAIAVVTAALAVPYSLTHGFLGLGFALDRGFALVCHQRPERCFWMFGAPVAVCTRCLGIYAGAAMGLLLRISRHIALRLLVVAAGLNLLDVLTEFAGLHGDWKLVRFALGLALGSAGAMLISASTRAALAN
jgi:uncharacterized membrane protein